MSWRLLSWKMVDSEDRDIAQPFGETVKGSTVYFSDGYMSAIVSSPEAKLWAKWKDPLAEKALNAARLINAYTRKYFLNEVPGNKQSVFHEIRISMPPNLEGAAQKRSVEIIGRDQQLFMKIKVDHEVEWFDCEGHLLLNWRKSKMTTGHQQLQSSFWESASQSRIIV